MKAGLAPRRRARGMTLVELMVGLAVGLFVSLIAIAVFVSTRTLNVVSSSSSRMSENARLAMDVLQEDLRSADFKGCGARGTATPVSVLSTSAAATAAFLDTGSGLAGNSGTGTGFAPGLSAVVAALTPANNSDILTLRVPVDKLALGLTTKMTAGAAAAPQVGAATAGNTMQRGDIVLITNCKVSTIFQVTDSNPAATGNLAHAVGGGFTPGNALLQLNTQPYRTDASVYRLQTRHYYVAASATAPGRSPGSNSLWRYTVPAPAGATNPEEMAVGIDRLNVSWGIANTLDPLTANRYVTADNVPDWGRVISARVQMLAATTRDNVAQSAQTVEFAGASAVATDRKLRTALTEVVSLRSHAP